MTARIGITGIAVALALAASAALGAETLVPTEIVVVVEQRYEARTAFDRTLKELPGIELPVAETVEDIVFAIGADVADDHGDHHRRGAWPALYRA